MFFFKMSFFPRVLLISNQRQIETMCGLGGGEIHLTLHSLLLLLSLLLLIISSEVRYGYSSIDSNYTRDDFPPPPVFVFGTGASAYQYEGAVAEDGRTPSIWDTFTQHGGMADKSTGDITADGYHKYKEDVTFMANTGLEAYRFSISWSRILPNGRGVVNQKGLNYYHDFINGLAKHGIQPHVTLYHFDLPQVLQDEYGGWLSPKIVDDFTAYADVCFREFGDRVSHWTTINQPNIIGIASYDSGIWPPNRCSRPFGVYNCSTGNSTTEPYVAMHNVLLAHATTVKLYRTKYQAIQNGFIGLNVYTFWFAPYSDSTADVKATERASDFLLGWVLNPVVYGDYPKIMREIVGSRLPSFTKGESELVKGSFDFFGINQYVTTYISDSPLKSGLRDFNEDMSISLATSRNATPSQGQYVPGGPTPIDPVGLERILEFLKRKYKDPPLYIHENGFASPYNSTLDDQDRIDAIKGFVGGVLGAIRNGTNVKGYFVWSFVDLFEFLAGYQSRYGLYHVDFEAEDRKRTPKLSAVWYKKFLKKNKSLSILQPSLNGTSHISH